MRATELGAMVEAIGVMLAGYAFFFELSRGSRVFLTKLLDDENALGATARDARMVRTDVRSAIPVAVALAAAPIVVAIVFAPPALTIVSSVDASKPYDALAASLVLMEAIWVVVACLMLRSLRRYWRFFRFVEKEAVDRIESQRRADAERNAAWAHSRAAQDEYQAIGRASAGFSPDHEPETKTESGAVEVAPPES